MKLSPFIFSLFLSLPVWGQINFEKPDWQQAVEKARKEKKLLMLYTNTEWCEPCLEMELGVFQDPEVGKVYNQAFVNVPFDMEGYPGIEIAERYQVDIYPTFLFLNEYGEVVHRGCGLMEKEGFLLLAKDAVGDSSILKLRKQFEAGDRSVPLLVAYTALLEAACMDKGPFVKSYFRDLHHDQWLTPATWTMINLNIQDPNSAEFEFLTTYHDRFAILFGRDTIDQKIYQVLLDQFIEIYEGEDLTLFALQSLRRLAAPLTFANRDRLVSMIDLEYAELVEDWELFATSAEKVVLDQALSDPDLINEFAWKFYLHVADSGKIKTALNWMEPIVAATPDANAMDTYASLLYKSGDKKEAVKWEKKAIAQAKDQLEDLLHYQLQLEKFEKGY
jgi:thioredoxin-related protein